MVFREMTGILLGFLADLGCFQIIQDSTTFRLFRDLNKLLVKGTQIDDTVFFIFFPPTPLSLAHGAVTSYPLRTNMLSGLEWSSVMHAAFPFRQNAVDTPEPLHRSWVKHCRWWAERSRRSVQLLGDYRDKCSPQTCTALDAAFVKESIHLSCII